MRQRRTIEEAVAVEMYDCGDSDCRLIHLLLVDKDGQKFAACALKIGQIKEIVEAGSDILYLKAALK